MGLSGSNVHVRDGCTKTACWKTPLIVMEKKHCVHFAKLSIDRFATLGLLVFLPRTIALQKKNF